MKNETFINLRKKQKLSQAKLSEQMYVPISTIRNWERGTSIPSIEDMKKLSILFKVEENIILSIFKPSDSKISQNNKQNSEMYKLFSKLFWSCNTARQFIQLTHLFSLIKMSGTVNYSDCIFPFTKIISDVNGSVAIFLDFSKNMIILTETHIKEIKPVSSHFDVYTFDIVTDFPIFPISVPYCPRSFTQKVRASFFYYHKVGLY